VPPTSLRSAICCGLVGWGLWLLATADPDGGRHPAGVFMVTVGIVIGLWVAFGARRRLR